MCPCDTWTMENVTHGKMNSRVRGSFLSLEGNQTIWWGRGEEKKREKERGKKWRLGQCMIRERGGRDLRFSSRSPAYRRSKLVGARGKVGLRDKGYEWVPKSEFFIEVQKKCRVFSYTGSS